MQKTIKFRAWVKKWSDSKFEMVYYPFMATSPDNSLIFWEIETDHYIDESIVEFQVFEPMQFTCLLDRTGKEIFVGDILKTDRGNYFVKECLPFIQLQRSDSELYDNGDYYEGGNIEDHKWHTFEVIGNIYENPELLDAHTR